MQESFDLQTRMMEVVRAIREIPELPSEQPKDVSPLLKVELPDEGGILTYMGSQSYPYRGFPYYEFVEKIDYIKKTSRAFLSSLYHSFKGKNRLWFIFLIPSLLFLKPLVRAWIHTYYRIVERFRIKSLRYCTAIRELHRAFSIEPENESDQDKELRIEVRDLICMILENDNAYRFRFQDISQDINKESLQRNPPRELIRLFDILQSCETGEDIRNTWILFKLFIRFYLRFDKKFCKILVRALVNLDYSRVQLTDEDKYYCSGRKDYNFRWIHQCKNQISNSNLRDRSIYEIFLLDQKKRTELEEIRAQYIKKVDILNTAQAIEKQQGDFTEKHKNEQNLLSLEFQPLLETVEVCYKENLKKIQIYVNN